MSVERNSGGEATGSENSRLAMALRRAGRPRLTVLRRRPPRKPLAWAGGLAVSALFILGALTGPIANASTQTKYYDLTVTHSVTVYAAVPSAVTITLTNDLTSTQSFGSAELTIGSLPQSAIEIGAGAVSAPGWSASFVSSTSAVVELTSQKGYELAPGASVSTTLTITPPAAGSITVGTEVKQSNDFSGSGKGFILVGDSGNPITVVPLALEFTQQPPAYLQQSVPTAKAFSYMCPAVGVQLVNSTGSPVDASGVDITISAPTGSSGPGLYFGTTSGSDVVVATNSYGEAVFGTCSSGLAATNLSTQGTQFFLTASSPAAATSVPSSGFSVVQSYVVCSGSCTTSLQSSTTGTAGQVSAQDSNASSNTTFDLAASFGTGLQLSCDSSVASSAPDPLQVTTSTASASGTVTMTFPKSIVNSVPNNGTPNMPVCVGATQRFAGSNTLPLSGTETDSLYPYQGLLYACDSASYTAYFANYPSGLQICVSSYAKIHGGAETVVISTNSLGDPMFW